MQLSLKIIFALSRKTYIKFYIKPVFKIKSDKHKSLLLTSRQLKTWPVDYRFPISMGY